MQEKYKEEDNPEAEENFDDKQAVVLPIGFKGQRRSREVFF